ncbi:MAG: cation transporter [Spirochaetales bacterium]|nr:cation transporter [Spirochaetales bacterium]
MGAALASLFLATLLAIIKLYQSYQSNSVGLLASGVDSLVDIAAALVLLLAILGSDRPADNEHRYGHGKYEALGSFLRSLFVMLSAFYICYRGLLRMETGEPLTLVTESLVVMIVSLSLTLTVFLYQSHVVKKTGSLAIAADRLNYLGDLGSGLLVIVGLLLEGFFSFRGADVLGGLLLALYLGYGALHILRDSLAVLLDRDISADFAPVIARFVQENKSVVYGFHDVRSRTAGNMHFLEFHLELEGSLAFRESHALVEALMQRLQESFPDLQVIIHAEPGG